MLKPEFFAPLLVGIGAFVVLFAKSDKKKRVGEILIGFAILFIGLTFMSDAILPYRESPVFSGAFTVLGKNPILAVLAGAVVTAIIQSSSASVGILQTLAMNGIVGWNSAIFITLGQNIGTCVTALLSSAGSGRNGKRASVIHLSFNVFGAVIFGILMYILFAIFPDWGNSAISSVEISIFHTVFNVSNTVLLFPFADKLVELSGKLVRGEDETVPADGEREAVQKLSRRLDRRLLNNPSFALAAVAAGGGCHGAGGLRESGIRAGSSPGRQRGAGAGNLRKGEGHQRYGKGVDGFSGGSGQPVPDGNGSMSR